MFLGKLKKYNIIKHNKSIIIQKYLKRIITKRIVEQMKIDAHN